MQLNKRTVLRLFFVGEIVVFCFVYLFGAQGMHVVWQLQRENNVLEQEVVRKKDELVALNGELDAWHHDPFLKEKYAREQLHMAGENDEVYYLR